MARAVAITCLGFTFKGEIGFYIPHRKLGLPPLNTLTPQTPSKFTHWDAHDPTVGNSMIYPPRQIDYICASENVAAIFQSRGATFSCNGFRPSTNRVFDPFPHDGRGAGDNEGTRDEHVREIHKSSIGFFRTRGISTPFATNVGLKPSISSTVDVRLTARSPRSTLLQTEASSEDKGQDGHSALSPVVTQWVSLSLLCLRVGP